MSAYNMVQIAFTFLNFQPGHKSFINTTEIR